MSSIEAGKEFSYSYQLENMKIFLKRPISTKTQIEMLAHIKKTKATREIKLIKSETNYFIKTTPLKKLSTKLRITLNIPRKNKGYDLPLADIKNSLNIQNTEIPTPELIGYGYEKNFGLIKKLTIIHEYLEGYIDGLEWLKQNQTKAVYLIEKTFSLILEMHRTQKYHLDLWLRNIMLTQAEPYQMKVIDFELYMSGEAPSKDELLGFIFGYFYRLELKDFISEETYDQLTKKAVKEIKDLDEKSFKSTYEISKKNEISRKNRRQLFLGEITFDKPINIA